MPSGTSPRSWGDPRCRATYQARGMYPRKVACAIAHDSSWPPLASAPRPGRLAGDYLPHPPHPDAIVYTITVGHDAVRTTDGYRYPHQLEPLIGALREILSFGERRLRSKAA